MLNNSGLLRVLLFLGLIYGAEAAKRAGYISVPVQITIIVLLMVFFLFGKKIMARFKK